MAETFVNDNLFRNLSDTVFKIYEQLDLKTSPAKFTYLASFIKNSDLSVGAIRRPSGNTNTKEKMILDNFFPMMDTIHDFKDERSNKLAFDAVTTFAKNNLKDQAYDSLVLLHIKQYCYDEISNFNTCKFSRLCVPDVTSPLPLLYDDIESYMLLLAVKCKLIELIPNVSSLTNRTIATAYNNIFKLTPRLRVRNTSDAFDPGALNDTEQQMYEFFREDYTDPSTEKINFLVDTGDDLLKPILKGSAQNSRFAYILTQESVHDAATSKSTPLKPDRVRDKFGDNVYIEVFSDTSRTYSADSRFHSNYNIRFNGLSYNKTPRKEFFSTNVTYTKRKNPTDKKSFDVVLNQQQGHPTNVKTIRTETLKIFTAKKNRMPKAITDQLFDLKTITGEAFNSAVEAIYDKFHEKCTLKSPVDEETISFGFTKKRAGDGLQAEICNLVNTDPAKANLKCFKIKSPGSGAVSEIAGCNTTEYYYINRLVLVTFDRPLFAHCISNNIPAILSKDDHLFLFKPLNGPNPNNIPPIQTELHKLKVSSPAITPPTRMENKINMVKNYNQFLPSSKTPSKKKGGSTENQVDRSYPDPSENYLEIILETIDETNIFILRLLPLLFNAIGKEGMSPDTTSILGDLLEGANMIANKDLLGTYSISLVDPPPEVSDETAVIPERIGNYLRDTETCLTNINLKGDTINSFFTKPLNWRSTIPFVLNIRVRPTIKDLTDSDIDELNGYNFAPREVIEPVYDNKITEEDDANGDNEIHAYLNLADETSDDKDNEYRIKVHKLLRQDGERVFADSYILYFYKIIGDKQKFYKEITFTRSFIQGIIMGINNPEDVYVRSAVITLMARTRINEYLVLENLALISEGENFVIGDESHETITEGTKLGGAVELENKQMPLYTSFPGLNFYLEMFYNNDIVIYDKLETSNYLTVISYLKILKNYELQFLFDEYFSNGFSHDVHPCTVNKSVRIFFYFLVKEYESYKNTISYNLLEYFIKFDNPQKYMMVSDQLDDIIDYVYSGTFLPMPYTVNEMIRNNIPEKIPNNEIFANTLKYFDDLQYRIDSFQYSEGFENTYFSPYGFSNISKLFTDLAQPTLPIPTEIVPKIPHFVPTVNPITRNPITRNPISRNPISRNPTRNPISRNYTRRARNLLNLKNTHKISKHPFGTRSTKGFKRPSKQGSIYKTRPIKTGTRFKYRRVSRTKRVNSKSKKASAVIK